MPIIFFESADGSSNILTQTFPSVVDKPTPISLHRKSIELVVILPDTTAHCRVQIGACQRRMKEQVALVGVKVRNNIVENTPTPQRLRPIFAVYHYNVTDAVTNLRGVSRRALGQLTASCREHGPQGSVDSGLTDSYRIHALRSL